MGTQFFTLCCTSVGFLVDFIPVPVISGFTSAAAITIALGQVKVCVCVCVSEPFLKVVWFYANSLVDIGLNLEIIRIKTIF